MNQSWMYLCPLPPQPPSIPFLRWSQSRGFELPVSCSKFPLAIYFTHGSASVSMLRSQIGLPSPSLTGSACQFSKSVSPLLLCK